MPQMAPMNWLSLYFLFIITFFFFIVMNYFSFLYTPKTISKTKSKKIVSWKW